MMVNRVVLDHQQRWWLPPRRHPRTLALALGLATVLLLALAPVAALAGTETWTSAGGNQFWHNLGNWSTGFPPATGDDVVLTNACANTICDPLIYDQGSSGGGPNPQLRSVTLNANVRGYAISPSVSGTDVLNLQSGGTITDSNTSGGPDSLSTGGVLLGPATFTLSSGATGLQFLTRAITGTGPRPEWPADGESPLELLTEGTRLAGLDVGARGGS